MPFVVEVGARRGHVTIVFKLGHPNAATREVSLLAAPSHIVTLLALCQCWTIVTALVHKVGIWLTCSALLAAVVFRLGRSISIDERRPSTSSIIKSRRVSPKDDLFFFKSALRKVRDHCTDLLETLLLAVDAENKAEAYDQVRVSTSNLALICCSLFLTSY